MEIKEMRVFGTSPVYGFLNIDSKCYVVTLEKLESMKLDPVLEKALFGRTSKEWRESLKK